MQMFSIETLLWLRYKFEMKVRNPLLHVNQRDGWGARRFPIDSKNNYNYSLWKIVNTDWICERG